MIQFTEDAKEKIRGRARRNPGFMKRLKEETEEVFQGKLIVPDRGIGSWSHYYYCPACSVKLVFDREVPKKHRCPCCNKIFQGEPYDGAWWQLINTQNYDSAYKMAVIGMAAGEKDYTRKAIEILLEYARNYPNYEVHGNIPYNGPGRSGAQTLDEANFLRAFAITYDILSEHMTEEEKGLVRDSMLLPGAEFLLEYRHRQIHNHEVIINSAIAVIGILFARDELIKKALHGEYGLVYQLEHGMLENGMWFEGSFGYHFYALTSFMEFEKFALYTPYSNIHHPNYRFMLEMPFDCLEPDDSFPLLNDTNYGHLPRMKMQYEFAYRELGGEKLAYILNSGYKKEKRENLDAFLYGADEIETTEISPTVYHTEVGQPGHTVLRGKHGRYLLFKHDCYGGEHDHYDRLGISYLAYGKRAARDLGTTGYGARLHYDYYKNTGVHNTVVIGEENQAPVNAKLTRYEKRDGVIYAEARADWTEPYQMPDSFTIVQWSEEAYKNVVMERKIIWTEAYFLELFLVDSVPENEYTDWVFHIKGKEISPKEGRKLVSGDYFKKKPFSHLAEVTLEERKDLNGFQRIYQDGNISTTVFGMNRGEVVIDGVGPDNPSSEQVSYLIERHKGRQAVFAHVIETWEKEPVVASVKFQQIEGRLMVDILERDQKKREFNFALK